VFGEPDHRVLAEYFAMLEPRRPGNAKLAMANADTSSIESRPFGVCLLYPVRATETDKVSIGFELFFPNNDLPYDKSFTVRRASKHADVIVEVR
jgi:hypothetical protein